MDKAVTVTFVCDLWGVWAEAFGAPHLCEGVCETCCRAPEGARAVSACHQVLPRAQENGKWLQQRGLSLRSRWLGFLPFPRPSGALFSLLPAQPLLVPGGNGCLFLRSNVLSASAYD